MKLEQLQKTKMPILILGETGTGKTRLAKSISKSAQRFIHLNISTLNSSLFESELFGHVKGAFTGSTHKRIGFCEEVGDGILFLDEIGELDLELQSKILTLIDEGIYYPVGSSTPNKFLGKLIVATNKDLVNLVERGLFRKDLYYRLRFIEVRKQPLRKDPNKNQIIIEFINNLKIKKKKNLTFDSQTLDYLFHYQWPGNYRELKNTLEFVFDMCEGRVSVNELPHWIVKPQGNEIGASCKLDLKYQYALEDFERRYLNHLLITHHGRINVSAQVAGISKVTLISKLKKYGINRVNFKNVTVADVG